MDTLSFDLNELPGKQAHQYLLSAVAPRPIALASTIDENGNRNLSPFSYFNVFSSNPPILIFSPARRVRDNTIKHTLKNAHAIKEAVINVVSYGIVQQTSLSSTEYGDGVDEFAKAGFTPIASDLVKPFRVKEAPVQFECKINDIVALGDQGGAGNLILCEVVKMHVHKSVTDENDMIDTKKIDLVARMGGNWYCRGNGDALFEVEKPLVTLGVGVDSLPKSVQLSHHLTGNDLGKLGNVEHLPTEEEMQNFKNSETYGQLIGKSQNPTEKEIHTKAHELLQENRITEALYLLLINA